MTQLIKHKSAELVDIILTHYIDGVPSSTYKNELEKVTCGVDKKTRDAIDSNVKEVCKLIGMDVTKKGIFPPAIETEFLI